jgi:tetratricopeptide (TPR) repeat protein
MPFRRSLSAPLTLLAVFFLCREAAGEAQNVAIVKEFLRRTPLSAAEQREIAEAIRSVSPRTEWVLSDGGTVCSIVLIPVQKDKRAALQLRLEEMARTKASLRAHHLLYLRAWSGAGRKARYANEESVAEALADWDGKREEGERLKPGLSVAAASKDWGFALVRTREDSLKTLEKRIGGMSEGALDTAYCAALYPRARELFERGRYEEALPVYRELHDLRWARPVAYLDAAECFLRAGDPESAARLAAETVTELGGTMDHALLARAGDIALESGEEVLAERFYRRAIEKLRRE